MAAYFASKIVWRMCPTTRTIASTRLMLKRHLKYAHKFMKGSLNPQAQLKWKLNQTPNNVRNIHKSTNNAKINKTEEEEEFMNQLMQNNLTENVYTFREGVRYQVSDSIRTDANLNVLNSLLKVEKGRCFTFPHLQPANQKPFGTISIDCDGEMSKSRQVSIEYPKRSNNAENLEQPSRPIVNTVKSTGKLVDVNKKNYTTSAKDLQPLSKVKSSQVSLDVPVINANCNRIAEILQRTYNNNYNSAIKRICTIQEESEKKLKAKSKSKLTFSINSPRNIKSSRQNLLSFAKVEKNVNDSFNTQTTKNYNTSATTSDKASIEYIKLCTPKTEKKLPKIKPSACPPVTAQPALTSFDLKRLQKRDVTEPLRPCGPLKQCPPRADANLQIKQKKLPNVKVQTCERTQPSPLKDVSPLKRLKKSPVVQERPCPLAVTCPPRADEGLQILSKKLPNIPISQCPIVEPPPIKDSAPLLKLKKGDVLEPVKICIKEKCPPRADDGLTIASKKLPDVPVKPCPRSEPKPPKDCAPLKRLNKGDVEEPQRFKACIQETCPPRADAGLTLRNKKLQNIPPKQCPIVEPEPLREGAPFKRLTKGPVLEPERICIKEECPVRKDQDMKIEPRSLPKIQFNDCPPVEIPTVQSAPPLKRLEKKDIPEPVKECPKESCEQNPRADRDCWAYVKLINESNDSSGKRKYSTCVVKNGDLSDNSPPVTVNNSKKPLFSPIDFVNFIIYKSNLRQIGPTKSLIKNEDYLQPSTQLFPEKEPFISSLDKTDIGQIQQLKSTRDKKTKEFHEDEKPDNAVCFRKTCEDSMSATSDPENPTTIEKESTLWQKVVNYFKARPGCPTPEELRMKRLREKAERAAAEAGLCLYDPKKCEISCKK